MLYDKNDPTEKSPMTNDDLDLDNEIEYEAPEHEEINRKGIKGGRLRRDRDPIPNREQGTL